MHKDFIVTNILVRNSVVKITHAEFSKTLP
jgi:hypothetical protein